MSQDTLAFFTDGWFTDIVSEDETLTVFTGGWFGPTTVVAQNFLVSIIDGIIAQDSRNLKLVGRLALEEFRASIIQKLFYNAVISKRLGIVGTIREI